MFRSFSHNTESHNYFFFQISQPGPEATSRAAYIMKEVREVPKFVEELVLSMCKLINDFFQV
jgi:hypothetical protein